MVRRGIFLGFANNRPRHGASGALSIVVVKALAPGLAAAGDKGGLRAAPGSRGPAGQEKRGRVVADATRTGSASGTKGRGARLLPGCPEPCVHVYFGRANSDKLSNGITCLIGFKR